MEEAVAARIRANPDYVELEASRRSFGWTLTIIMLVVYYGFLAVVAFVPSIIPQPLFGNVTVGIILGLGVIVTAILLTRWHGHDAPPHCVGYADGGSGLGCG